MSNLPATSPAIEVALPIEGMTCASCVNRIERFLRKTPGVQDANVNLATELATIVYLPDVAGPADLVGAVEAAGYEIRVRPAATDHDADASSPADERTADDLLRARESRLLLVQAVGSIAVALAIMALMAAPADLATMEERNLLALVPATIVQAWAGRRFYRAAWRAARHGSQQHGHARGHRDERRPGRTASS